MVMPWAQAVHAEGANPARSPAFPQGAQAPVAPARPGNPTLRLELGNQLRPDRDHPNEQRNRRQRRSLFHEYLQHTRLLIWEHKKNIVLFLFRESRGGSGAVWEVSPKEIPWLIPGMGRPGLAPDGNPRLGSRHGPVGIR
jgi:hypothetical protein